MPDGEPTLDSRLGEQLRLLRPLGIPLAVITNASLLSREDVRRDLVGADRVSIKVDAVRHETWRRVDRPHGDLRLEDILDGVVQFSRDFGGTVDTETMLVKDLNDSVDDLTPLAAFLEQVNRRGPTSLSPLDPPPSRASGRPAKTHSSGRMTSLSASVGQVELLTGYEGTSFASTGDARADLLAITAVHPMRADQVEALLERCGDLVGRGRVARAAAEAAERSSTADTASSCVASLTLVSPRRAGQRRTGMDMKLLLRKL